MKTKTFYEWMVETLDEYGDVIECISCSSREEAEEQAKAHQGVEISLSKSIIFVEDDK